MGFRSEIFAGDFEPALARRCIPYREFPRHSAGDEPWLVYQSSIGSPMADFLIERSEPKLLNFHNITPAGLIEGWEPGLVEEVNVGRVQLTRLASEVRGAIAVSDFNQCELREFGFQNTEVAPLLVDLDAFDRDVDKAAVNRLEEAKRRGGQDILFVGRIVPHKAQHDVIKVLAAYRHLYDPHARLHLVGGDGSRSYRRALEQFVAELGLDEAVDFAGSVTPQVLSAYYRAADVFVCCSDHEGFCVPLLEAMHNSVPIVGYGAAAVPETIGGVGLIMANKSPVEMAAAVSKVLSDAGLRSSMVAAGQARVAERCLERARQRFAAVIRKLTG